MIGSLEQIAESLPETGTDGPLQWGPYLWRDEMELAVWETWGGAEAGRPLGPLVAVFIGPRRKQLLALLLSGLHA